MPDQQDLELLISRRGVPLSACAEKAPPGFIASCRTGLLIALGHSMATYEQTKAAMAEGLSGFMHLFNAMRPLNSRDPGPVAAALENPRASYGIIVDGEHVAPSMLKLALRGSARPMLVTDAMPPAGGHKGAFTLYGEEIAVRDGRLSRADGTLAGAALDMATAVKNCVELLNVRLTWALRFASAEPAQFLGLGNELGRIAEGSAPIWWPSSRPICIFTEPGSPANLPPSDVSSGESRNCLRALRPSAHRQLRDNAAPNPYFAVPLSPNRICSGAEAEVKDGGSYCCTSPNTCLVRVTAEFGSQHGVHVCDSRFSFLQVIPTAKIHDTFAHVRLVRVTIVSDAAMSAFQASQQASTMSS